MADGDRGVVSQTQHLAPPPRASELPLPVAGLKIERPIPVWAMDVTYTPMARDFVYLAAVVTWYSRRVLSWRLSITSDRAFCIDALEEALQRYGVIPHF